MSEERFIFENEDFFVDVEMEADAPLTRDGATYEDFYVVVNKKYGVVEYKTPSVVEAISGAAMAQATLNGEPWKFYEKKQKTELEYAPGKVVLQ
jgi:hypothetical protein